MELRLEKVISCFLTLEEKSDEPICAYVYDLNALHRHVTRLVESIPKSCKLYYAIKANSDLPILKTLAPLVDGFEVSSGGELDWVRKHFPDISVIFSGPGKLDRELHDAISRDVECVHIESFNELQRLTDIAQQVGKTVTVLLRINLPVDGLVKTSLVMGGTPTPFGIHVEQLETCLNWMRRHPGIELRGFHFHLLSHQLDATAHLNLLTAYQIQVRQWCDEYDLKIEHINMGGGIGINYRQPDQQFNWQVFASGLGVLSDNGVLPGAALRFELGRYMTAACGYYAMQVIDIKRSYGQTFLVGRGGTHHFRTPYAQGHSHPFYVVPVNHWPCVFPRPKITNDKVSVVGQLCTPKDLLAYDAPVESVSCGDLLVFPYAGAYAWNISHHDFLRHPYPIQQYLPVEKE